MHHWVKYCVNRCMKSEVISLISFCIATQKIPRKVGQYHSSSNSFKAMVGCITGSILCKSVQEIRSYRVNEILHCDLEKEVKSRSKSLFFELIQGHGGMHDWINYL